MAQTPDDKMVPRATLEEIAAQVRDLMALRDKQLLTIAEMVRACVFWLRIDVQKHRCGHLAAYSRERAAQVSKNKQEQARAMAYLEALATRIEDSARKCEEVSDG